MAHVCGKPYLQCTLGWCEAWGLTLNAVSAWCDGGYLGGCKGCGNHCLGDLGREGGYARWVEVSLDGCEEQDDPCNEHCCIDCFWYSLSSDSATARIWQCFIDLTDNLRFVLVFSKAIIKPTWLVASSLSPSVFRLSSIVLLSWKCLVNIQGGFFLTSPPLKS